MLNNSWMQMAMANSLPTISSSCGINGRQFWLTKCLVLVALRRGSWLDWSTSKSWWDGKFIIFPFLIYIIINYGIQSSTIFHYISELNHFCFFGRTSYVAFFQPTASPLSVETVATLERSCRRLRSANTSPGVQSSIFFFSYMCLLLSFSTCCLLNGGSPNSSAEFFAS
jgi:hypothetical protein